MSINLRTLSIFLALFFLSLSIFAQKDSLKVSEEERELKIKGLVLEKADTFITSTIALLDGAVNIDAKHDAREDIMELFDNQKRILDYIEEDYPIYYSSEEYVLNLFYIHLLRYQYRKKYKLSDSVEIRKGPKRSGLDSIITYKGHCFILEELTSSKTMDWCGNSFTTTEKYIRDIPFSCEIDTSHSPPLTSIRFERIKFISENNYRYKELRKEIKKNKHEWKEVGFTRKNNEALDTQIPPEKRNYAEYHPPVLKNYLVPGFASCYYTGNKTSNTLLSGVYSSVFVGSIAYSIYNKIEEKKQFDLYMQDRIIEDQNYHYHRMKKHKKYFLISGGVAVLTWITHLTHVASYNKIQLNKTKTNDPDADLGMRSTPIMLKYEPMVSSDNGIGLSFTLNF